MAIILSKQPLDFSPVRNPISVRFSVLTLWRLVSGYSIKCKVLTETLPGSGVYQEVIELPGSIDENDFVQWNVASIIEGKMSQEVPSLTFGGGKVAGNMFLRYKLEINEYVNSTSILSYSIEPKVAISAGLAKGKRAELDAMIKAGSFLTNQSRAKKITANQPEFLAFGLPFGISAGSFQLMAKLLFEDGSTSADFSGPSVSGQEGDLLLFAAGYNQLNLGQAPAALAVIGYELWVKEVSSGNTISEVMQYRFDGCKCSPLDRFYVFENTFGGFDSVRTTGQASIAQSQGGQEAYLMPDINNDGLEAEYINFAITHQVKIEQNIGYQSTSDQAWLRELLRPKTCFRVGDFLPNPDGEGELVPIKLELGEVPLMVDEKFFHKLSFKYSEAFNEVGV